LDYSRLRSFRALFYNLDRSLSSQLAAIKNILTSFWYK
jgi:hypothetical protein